MDRLLRWNKPWDGNSSAPNQIVTGCVCSWKACVVSLAYNYDDATRTNLQADRLNYLCTPFLVPSWLLPRPEIWQLQWYLGFLT